MKPSPQSASGSATLGLGAVLLVALLLKLETTLWMCVSFLMPHPGIIPFPGRARNQLVEESLLIDLIHLAVLVILLLGRGHAVRSLDRAARSARPATRVFIGLQAAVGLGAILATIDTLFGILPFGMDPWRHSLRDVLVDPETLAAILLAIGGSLLMLRGRWIAFHWRRWERRDRLAGRLPRRAPDDAP